jgi:glucosamine--fructose-6-phosphate aminotransferase (isomerizing)
LIAARGSSDNAARYAQYLLGSAAGLEVGLATPWLFGPGRRAPRLTGAAVIAISQSGRSPDVSSVLEAARVQGRPAIAITNDRDSPLAAQADVVVELGVGVERSVAATKTYLGSLHAFALIAAELAPDRLSAGWLDRVPELVTDLATAQLGTRERFDPLADCGWLTAVGRGLDYSTACESALKLRELSGIPAEGLSPPDLIHGPLGALEARTGVWLVGATAPQEAEALELLERIRGRAGVAVAVSADRRLLADATVAVELPPGLPDWVGALAAVVPAQAAALRLAELRGVEVDRPNGLTKVTRTR